LRYTVMRLFHREKSMPRCYSIALLVTCLFAAPVLAIEPFPSSIHTEEIKTNGTSLHVRIGGQGPAVVFLHGFGDTGDMWAPAAAALMKTHTVVVPDLRVIMKEGVAHHPHSLVDPTPIADWIERHIHPVETNRPAFADSNFTKTY
jgi:hypothetical protein